MIKPSIELGRVIKTLLDLNGSPAKYKWTNKEWSVWRLLTKHFQHIGIELEYQPAEGFEFPVRGQSSSIFIGKIGMHHTRLPYLYQGQPEEGEISQLFPLYSPTDFTSTIHRFVTMCKKNKVTTFGSIHWNIIYPNNYYANVEYHNKSVGFRSHTSIKDYATVILKKDHNTSNYFRSENKRGSGFILEQDLRAQAILFLCAHNVIEMADYKEILNIVEENYPSNLKNHWARINLSKVLV